MPIIVDLIMIALLVGVIMHSLRLSKSLDNFKSIHAEITPLMKDHAITLAKCFRQIDELKTVSQEIDHIINSRVPAALKIQGDLEFLVGRADELANHLETMISDGRSIQFSDKKTTKNLVEAEELVDLSEEEELAPSKPEKKKRAVAKPTLKRDISLFASKDELEKTETKAVKTTLEPFFLTKTAKKLLHRKSGEEDAA